MMKHPGNFFYELIVADNTPNPNTTDESEAINPSDMFCGLCEDEMGQYASSNRIFIPLKYKTFIKKLLREGNQVEIVEKGSSLKLCLVADGTADVYPRFGNTMEWDIAAGHAVIKYAGKDVYDIHTKQPLTYNKASLLNPHFIAE